MPRPAGDRAEFVAAFGEPLADVVGELGGEGTGADARRVSLHDAEHVVDHARADAGPGAGGTGDAVRARHVRVRAVIDVEQRALRAFEQQRLAARACTLDRGRHVPDHRRDRLALRECLVARPREVDRLRLVVVDEHEIVQVEQALELLGEARGLEQVLHAQRAPRDLVLVRGADAAAGRADLQRRAERGLARLVERDVDRQHERARRRDDEARAHVDARLLELADLLHERRRRQHDAVADQDRHALAQHARRDEAQDRLASADDERVPGVVAALEAHDTLRALGQPVDDLALAFVAPLGADDDDVLGHDRVRSF